MSFHWHSLASGVVDSFCIWVLKIYSSLKVFLSNLYIVSDEQDFIEELLNERSCWDSTDEVLKSYSNREVSHSNLNSVLDEYDFVEKLLNEFWLRQFG